MKLALVVLCALTVRSRADIDPLVDPGSQAPPAVEVVRPVHQVTIPTVPTFDLPKFNPDGSHTVKEMRVRGKQFLDREVTIKGTITWAYDCVTANLGPGKTEKQVRELIDDDPTICERPKFYVGDSGGTSPDLSIWIVDVPRAYNKMELKRIKKSDRTDPNKCEPDEKDPKNKRCPPYKVGDQVEITGTFALSSPHSERNSDGLVVYGHMKNLTQKWESPGTFTRPPALPGAREPTWQPAALPAIPKTPAKAKIRKSAFDAATKYTASAMVAARAKQFETAIEQYNKAVEQWPEHALAWFGLSVAYAQRLQWDKAADAAAHPVAIEPGVAMYRLVYGRMLFEKAISQARQDLARKQNMKPEEVEPDLSTVSFEKALVELRQAATLNPDLWRAHYLIGTIHRHAGRPKEAVVALSKALASEPPEANPWVALAEVYRAWDYTDQAIQVAQQAAIGVTAPDAQSDVLFELGMAYDDKRLDDKAIEAFTKALDARRDNYKALFARGQAYYRKGNLADAKRDLEAFSKSPVRGGDFFKQQASRMLMDIAAKAGKQP